MKIEVRQGIIHINSIKVLQKTDNAILLCADCKQKYPEFSGISDGDGDYFSFFIDADERTLNVDDPEEVNTEIIVTGLEGKWRCTADAGRYTVLMFLIKFPGKEDYPCIWDDSLDK